MKYLFFATIGPVQEFIAAARRTRDLRFGSQLLSELTKAIARQVRQRGELIFPFSSTIDADLNNPDYPVSNKILAIIQAQDEKDLRNFADDLHNTARKRLRESSDEALKLAYRLAVLPGGIDESRTEAQLHDMIEFYASWTPYDDQHHSRCRADVDQWAAARKGLRDFQPNRGDKVPKSSLDGIRETVLRKESLRGEQHFIKPNEQLAGIGIVKRFAGENPRFDSTIDVAAVPYISRLSARHPEALAEYENYLHAHQKDMPFTYGHLYRTDSEQPVKHAAAIDAILRKARFPEPKPPYYAFLIGDGDNMGKTISAIDSKPAHQEFSERMSRFSASIEELANQHASWNVVFAGGDDVVALLPLNEALEAARQFRDCFTTAVDGLRKAPTFSVGMVIAHATEPLSDVRKAAKQAEHQAKEIDELKNALAVWAIPRSGAPVKLCGKWGPLLTDLQKAVDFYCDRSISPGFAHALRNLLDSTERRNLKHLDETLFPLARAIAEKREAKPRFLAWLQQAENGIEPQDIRNVLDRLANLLLVARPIARAVREARS